MESGERSSVDRFLTALIDEKSFVEWGCSPAEVEDDGAGVERGQPHVDSILVGAASVHGHPVALILSNFDFMGGSIGVVAASRLVEGIQRATREGLPILAAPASGGTRMQDGVVGFMQLPKICDVIADHKRAGLPYLVYLRHPSMGGTLASWGSLGHVTFAEPGALIGFLGPRVFRALTGESFPSGVQVSERLNHVGILDGVLPVGEFRDVLADVFTITGTHAQNCTPEDLAELRARAGSLFVEEERGPNCSVWDSISETRRPERPGGRAVLLEAESTVLLRGSGEAGVDDSTVLCLAMFGKQGCVVVAQDRHAQDCDQQLMPAGLRVARRGMLLAEQLGLPLVTIIDTCGAALSRDAEEDGLSRQIALCMAEMMALQVPSVSILMGEGTGGAAIALLPSNRVLACENGWLSPLPLEGASVIAFGTPERAPEMAEAQGVGAFAMRDAQIVDGVISERAPMDAGDLPRRISTAIEYVLMDLQSALQLSYVAARKDRYGNLGTRGD